MAGFYSLGGLHGGRLDPRLIPLIIIALIAFRRNSIAERIASWLPFGVSDRQLKWTTWISTMVVYTGTCWIYAVYASGTWAWSPGVVFIGVELFRLLCNDLSQSVLGEPFDK